MVYCTKVKHYTIIVLNARSRQLRMVYCTKDKHYTIIVLKARSRQLRMVYCTKDNRAHLLEQNVKRLPI